MAAHYTWTTFPSPIGSLILAEVDGQPMVVEYQYPSLRIPVKPSLTMTVSAGRMISASVSIGR